MNIRPARRMLPLLLLCWILSACAALPDVHQLSDTLEPAATPIITNASGDALPAARTRALLTRRWHQSGLDPAAQAALEEAATGLPLIAGNKVTLLFDGPQTMAEMFKAIGAAKNNINLETYIFDQDELGLKFADLLIERQQAGVAVSIVYDSVGTLGVPQQFFDRMRAAGIHLLAFNPVNPARLRGDAWIINNRDHRKLLIVDGKVAFTGGINISATYARSSLFRSRAARRAPSQPGWRDTHVKIEGPAVAALQWIFIRTWLGQGGADLSAIEPIKATTPGAHLPGATPPGANLPMTNPPGANPPGANPPVAHPPGAYPPGANPPGANLHGATQPGAYPSAAYPPGANRAGAAFFPPLAAAGDKLVRVIASEPGGGFEIYKAYILAIQEAQRSIHITCAYFAPDQQTIDALRAAARRGVDVRIVLPGVSDSGLVSYASHALYDQLLESGIRIYHLKKAVLHAKTAVIDGVWSTVGSANIDMRSFLHNSELNVVVPGEGFGREMENAFQEDVRGSLEVTRAKWRQRPLADRIKEWAARVLSYWL